MFRMNFKESCIVIFIFSLNFDLIYTKCVKIEDIITLDSEVLQSRFKKLTMLKNSEDPALWDWDLKPSRFGNEEKKNHEQTWILLHGVGGNAEHMIPFAEIIAQRTPSAQIIIPQAPEINHMHRKEWGSRPSWFDFYGCQPHHEDINNGIDHTVAYLRLIVEKEIELKGIEPRKIFIAGYSQGGAVAVYSAIMIGGDLELGAGVAFSGRVPSRANIMNLPKDYNLQTKILFCRGRLDPIISTTWFNHQIIQIQDRWPNLINVITYDDMAHVQNSKMFNDVLDFLPI